MEYMTVKKFDSLSRRDFDNGGMLDDIRSQLKQDAKRIAELEGERDAALRNAIRWREACERFAPGDLPHERE